MADFERQPQVPSAFIAEENISAAGIQQVPPDAGWRYHLRRQNSLWRLAAALLLVALSMTLLLIAKGNPVWVSESYRPVGRFLSQAVGLVFRLMPFSLFELVIVGLVLAILVSLVVSLTRGIRRKRTLLHLLSWFSRVFLGAAILLFLFFALWGLNYDAAPLADDFGLTQVPYSAQELAETTSYLFDRVTALSDEVPRTAEGILALPSFDVQRENILSAYRALGESVPLYDAGVAPPKVFLLGDPYAYFNVAGMYMPLTAEASVVADLPAIHMPFSLAHEVGHSYGLAREDEANFSAFSACLASDDPALQYSGYCLAFLYCINALQSSDPQAAAEVVSGGYPPGLSADLADYSAYLDRFASPLNEVGTSINDGYLKTMGQDEGVRSYGLMVDLVAWSYLSGIY